MTASDRWRRIEEIFQAALDIPPEQRDAYLGSACADDSGLRQEVESLLAHDATTREYEESPIISGIIEDTAASLFDEDGPSAAKPDSLVGSELGHYRIIREIGRGGMGAVYLAVRADQTFEKQVAIKLVKRGIDTDSVLQRFWYERRILAGLEHPYIARLVDGGTSPDGRPYFVMEYVNGQTLDTYVPEKHLSVNQCCEIFLKICEAVSYAHRNLIIHRDLKPANVLVTADGTPKLLDFGIARLLSVDPAEHTIAGPVSSRALTPEFASPEQARGEAVTTATDVYSLGKTLLAILPTNAPLPQDLATILGKAVREESEQRFASVADLSGDLRRYLAGLPILARDQTLAYRTAKFVRRHRVGVAVIALFGLLLIAGISAIAWESHKAELERRQAEQRLSQAVGMAQQTLKDVNGSIAMLPGTMEARRQMVRNTLDYLNQLSKDSGDDPRVLAALATAYVRVGDVLGNSDFPNLGDLPGSLATYQRAMGVVEPLLKKDAPNLGLELLASEAHEGIGQVLRAMGHEKEAEAECRNAIALADRALAENPGDRDAQFRSIDTHYALAFLRYTGSPEEARKDMEQELPIAEKLAAAQPGSLDAQTELSNIYSLIGTCLNRVWKLEESLAYYRKAVEVREAISRQNPRNPQSQRNLMLGYGHIGDVLGNPFTGCLEDYRGALEYFEKAARIAEEMSRADPEDKRASLDVAMVWTRVGATLQGAGELKPSNEALDRAIARFEPLMASAPGNAPYARGVSIAYEFRGRTTWLEGDRAAAIGWYRKSLALTDKLLAAHPDDIQAQSQHVADLGPIAVLLALNGDRAGAVKTARELIQEAKDLSAHYTKVHLARAWRWYGDTYEALGDFHTALAAYEQSVVVWQTDAKAARVRQYQRAIEEAQRKAAECREKIAAN